MVRESLGKLKYQCAKVNKDAEKNRTVLRTLHKFIRITALSEKYILMKNQNNYCMRARCCRTTANECRIFCRNFVVTFVVTLSYDFL